MNKEQLKEELFTVGERYNELRQQLSDLESDEICKQLEVYKGKYFKEINNGNDGYIRCIFVFDIDKESQQLDSLDLHYYKINNKYFDMNHYRYFNPMKDKHEEWDEITKKEFLKHYKQVQKRIELSML